MAKAKKKTLAPQLIFIEKRAKLSARQEEMVHRIAYAAMKGGGKTPPKRPRGCSVCPASHKGRPNKGCTIVFRKRTVIIRCHY